MGPVHSSIFLENARFESRQLFLCSSYSVRQEALLNKQVDFPPEEQLIGGKMAAVQPVLEHSGDQLGPLVDALLEQFGFIQLFSQLFPLGLQ